MHRLLLLGLDVNIFDTNSEIASKRMNLQYQAIELELKLRQKRQVPIVRDLNRHQQIIPLLLSK